MSKSIYSINVPINTTLNSLSDVQIVSPLNSQVLKYNSSNQKWQNQNDTTGGINTLNIVSQESFLNFSIAALGDTRNFTFSFQNQINNKFLAASLSNNGTVLFRTIDVSDIPALTYLTSFNSRTGAVLPIEGDYSLNLLSDVTISTPLTNNILKYNGSEFINTFLNDNTYEIDTSCNSGATVNAVINKTYACNLGTLNIGNSSSGACIKIINNSASLTLNFLGLVYINGVNYFNQSFTSSETMYLEVKNYFNGTAWVLTNLTPRIFYPATGKYLYYCVSDIDNLRNVNIVAPVNNQILRFNGSQWVNNTDVISFNSRTGVVTAQNNDYSITQITNSSVLANSTNVNISSPLNNQILRYNGSQWSNNTDVISFNSRTGVVTAQNNDYSITQITNSSVLANSTNVNISSPVNSEILSFNGSQWINSKFKGFFSFNSDGNLSANQFLYVNGYGQQAVETRCQMFIPYNLTITEIGVNLTVAPGAAATRSFFVRVNGVNVAVCILGPTDTTVIQSINVVVTTAQFLSLQNLQVGATPSFGRIYLKYHYT